MDLSISIFSQNDEFQEILVSYSQPSFLCTIIKIHQDTLISWYKIIHTSFVWYKMILQKSNTLYCIQFIFKFHGNNTKTQIRKIRHKLLYDWPYFMNGNLSMQFWKVQLLLLLYFKFRHAQNTHSFQASLSKSAN